MRSKFLIIIMIVFSSCGRHDSTKKNITNSLLVVDLLSKPESVISRISEIASDVEYIPIQTTSSSLLKSITKIVTVSGRIYIRNNYDEILCFDSEGKFLYSLNKNGRGPGEFAFISDFDVSDDGKTIVVLSGGILLKFTDSGTGFVFDNSINLNHSSKYDIASPRTISLIPGTSNMLISNDPSTGKEKTLSVLINNIGDTLHFKPNCYMYDKTNKHFQMTNESLQYDFENDVYFKEEFSDTVFSVNKGSNMFYPKLILDSHGKGSSPGLRYNQEYSASIGGGYYWVYNIMESKRYIIYWLEHGMTRVKLLYDKSAGKKYSLKSNDPVGSDAHVFNPTCSLTDDINSGPPLDPVFVNGNVIYAIVEAMNLKKYVESLEYKNRPAINAAKKEELRKLSESLKETDNPVLVRITPKSAN
jgi:hypothetical protein